MNTEGGKFFYEKFLNDIELIEASCIMRINKIASFFVFLLWVSSLWASGQSFGYEIVKNPAGKIILKLKTEVKDEALFLGVSLYPPSVVNTLDQGKHFSFPVRQGVFSKEFEIDQDFEGGSFEAALWRNKLRKNDCPPDDVICQKLGYKHTGMVGYIWGILKIRLL